MGDYKGQSIRRSVASLVAFLIGVCVCVFTLCIQNKKASVVVWPLQD